MIEIKQLTKKFKKKAVLENLDLTLNEGIYGILGPNGAGKTTLMRCITELYDDYKGKILIDGKTVSKAKKENRIGYLPQHFSGFAEMTVYEMMEYFARLKKLPKKEEKEEIHRCLEFAGMTDYVKKKCGELSGGMVRRLGIAQAVLGNPDLLIMDEPTAGLDPEERIKFKRLMLQLEKNKTVLISTHIVEEIEVLCDKIIVMKDGKIAANDTVEELINAVDGIVKEVQDYDDTEFQDTAFIVQEYIKEGKKTARILTGERIGVPVTPRLEDAYMYIMKRGEMNVF